jgi:hypothetical protein|tara:strand:+ start:1220 stop:1573 length:354 start_codon:yes stop_codon:yes gene_type:complete
MLHKITGKDVTLKLSHEELRILHNMVYLRGDSYLYDIGEEKGIKDFEVEAEKFHSIREVAVGFDMITSLHYDIWAHPIHRIAMNKNKPELTDEILDEWKDKFKFWMNKIDLDDPENN